MGKGQKKVPVAFDFADESDRGPYPIPPKAPIEGGASADGDRHVLVVDRDRCRLYELFDARPQAGGARWTAGSGAIFDLRSNTLRPAGWTSADAAGLPILPGLARYADVANGLDRPRAALHGPPHAGAPTSTPRATSRPTTATRRCRRWACACG